MVLLLSILGVIAYIVIGFAVGVAIYIMGYEIELENDEIEDLLDYGDSPRFSAGAVAFFWPLALIAAIFIVIYLIGCYYVAYVGDIIISRTTAEKEK